MAEVLWRDAAACPRDATIDTGRALASLPPVTTPGSFADLTPDRILAAADETGVRATGRTWSLAALENRVYEVEREDDSRVVVKFYRPGRHSTAAILDEHRLLAALAEEEVPVVAPLALSGGETLRL